jgi:hypothetical protein
MGVVNILDLSLVAKQLPAGLWDCPQLYNPRNHNRHKCSDLGHQLQHEAERR